MKFRIEPDLKYCPKCHDEYRAEIVTCVSCAVKLLSGSELLEHQERKKAKLAGRTAEIQPDEELVDVRKGPLLDMKQVQALLARHQIPSLIVGEDQQSCGKGCCGGTVLLRVRKVDMEEVFAIFQREYIEATALHEHDIRFAGSVYNPSAAQATCPACGYTFSSQGNCCPDCGLCF